MRKNRFLLCGIIAAAAILTTACGQTATEQTSGQTKTENSTAEDSITQNASNAQMPTGEAEKLIGKWEAAATRSSYYSFEDQESSEDYYFHDYNEGNTALNELTFYEEDGKLMVDYYDASYYASSYYGLKGSVLQEQLYDGCKNTEWKCELTSDAARRNERAWSVTLVGENEMEVYTFDKYEEYGYQYETITTFLREGSAENDNRESYRYTQTIEVSNEAELVQALQETESSAKIILNEGVYDISGEYGLFESFYNVCIVGKEGARVEICIDNPYDSVIELSSCQNVLLENLIVGHVVEPGQCMGNVIQCNNSYGIRIRNCKLYGSGAYGVSAMDSYDITVTDSEIYECTYGLVEAYDSGSMSFDNCIFRDTEGYGLISLWRCSWVSFTNSVFKNCDAGSDNEFLSWPDSYYVEFDGCTFENIIYGSFSEAEPEIINCVFK